MSATVAAAVKAAIVILSNEEACKKVGWGIVAILSPLIVLVVLLCHAGVPKIHRGYAEQL